MHEVMEALGINETQYHSMINELTEHFWQYRGKMDLSADGIINHVMNNQSI